MAHHLWPASATELAEMRRFNKKLAWLPRFKIRNRFTPRVIQALLRAGQRLKRAPAAETRYAGSVPVRILRPSGKPKGVVLDIHGGGWVIGNAQMDDDLNLGMVNACDVAVVSVDYRLAVDTPVQGVMEDCLTAARWLLSADEFAGLPVIIVGESAGGHLAAATLLALKQWPELLKRVSGALLYYGVYDLTGTPSVRAAGPDTLLLDGPGMVDALQMLTPGLSDDERRQALLSPLYGDFTGLPPALMFVGELDPLKDDTLLIAERWPGAQVHLVPEAAHGFIHFPVGMAGKVLAYGRQWIVDKMSLEDPLGIRPVAADDVSQVLAFAQQARAEMFPKLSDAGVPNDLAQFEATYLQGDGRFLIACHDGQIVAAIGYLPYDNRFPQLNYQGRKTVEVVRLFVLPAFRRFGLAAALYRALEATAQAEGVEVMYLHTHPFLPGAIDFWLRQGFEVVDVEADPVWQTTHMQRTPQI